MASADKQRGVTDKSMDIRVIKKLTLARYLLSSADSFLRGTSETAVFAALNQYQDAVEMCLLGVAEHLNAGIGSQTTFEKYFDLINAKIAPKELPFRAKLIGLNKLRVAGKHHGIQPDRSEVKSLSLIVREFCEEVTKSILGVEFARISLTNAITKVVVRRALESAENHFAKGEFADCLIECRKAIYHEVDTHYDISVFRSGDRPKALEMWLTRAPGYARSGKYIDESVGDPTEYIVYDHQRVDAELSKVGVNQTLFWNVWRLTPHIFYDRDSDKWIVRSGFEIFDQEGIQSRAEFVLSATLEICLAFQRDRDAIRTPTRKDYVIKLKRPKVDLLKKADLKSEVQVKTSEDMTELFSDYKVTGFDGNTYWHVIFHKPPPFSGYVVDADVENVEHATLTLLKKIFKQETPSIQFESC
jgi:hypothetical protein